MSRNDTVPTPEPLQYEPPAVSELGSLMQITAGTGTAALADPAGTSI